MFPPQGDQLDQRTPSGWGTMEATTEIKVEVARLQVQQWLLEMAMELKERRLDIDVPVIKAFSLFLSHIPSLLTIHAMLPAHLCSSVHIYTS